MVKKTYAVSELCFTGKRNERSIRKPKGKRRQRKKKEVKQLEAEEEASTDRNMQSTCPAGVNH